MSKQKNPAKGVTWDLSGFYKSISDPEIKKDKETVLELSQSFVEKYKGKINQAELRIETLVTALQEYETILEKLYIIGSYLSLMHSKHTDSESIGKEYQSLREFSTTISNMLVFFELEIVELDESLVVEFLKKPELNNYSQYLLHTRKFKPYTLEEKQEILLSKKSQTGSQSFVRLYDQISNSLEFPVEIDGKVEQLSYSELATVLSSHPERETRIKAAEGLTSTLDQNKKTLGFILNTLLLDKQVTDEIRGYQFPQQATFLGDEIESETVDTMVTAIEQRYDISEKFYLEKSKALGGLKLTEVDRYSEIFTDVEERSFSYEQGRDLILKAFGEFHPEFSHIAKEFFDKNWIDAELNKGKRSGAFCSYTVPSKNPFILINYTGKQNDIRTLAHELGHGIHAYLSRKHNLLHYWPSTPIAEISSIFCESIIFDKIYHSITDRKQKTNLLAGKLQETFATIFRQNAFFLFESKIHDHRRTEGELAIEEFNNYFQDAVQAMFGKGLELSEGHKLWWMPVSHFYHYNFYVFSYSFGQTLTTALYAAYKHEPEAFLERYLKALETGGSKNLYEITQILGVDINAASFWKQGLEVIDQYVEEFRELVSEI